MNLGRCLINMEPFPPGEPGADPRALVRGVVVERQVDVEMCWDLEIDVAQE